MNFFKQKSNLVTLALIFIAVLGIGVFGLISLFGSGQTAEVSSSSQISSKPQTQSPSSETPSSSETVSSEPEEIKLSVTSPKSEKITVNTKNFTIRGSADPSSPVFLNGVVMSTDENGIFSKEITLKEGANELSISHKGEEKKFTVTFKKIIIKNISPSSSKTVESNDTLTVSCTALKDCTVTANFNGKTTYLYADDSQDNTGEYLTYVGSIKMPVNNEKDKSYGKITFRAWNENDTEIKKSGNITVKSFDPEKFDGGNGYPEDSRYLNVGTLYIAEVIAEQGETYSVSDATALSRPTNNYLPKGTVDYCSPFTKKYQSEGKDIETVNLRFGNKMHLLSSRGNVDVKIYSGTLPETNKIGVASYSNTGRHNVLILDVDWKAPFRFEISS